MLGRLEPDVIVDTNPEADGPEGDDSSVVTSEEMGDASGHSDNTQ